MGGVCHVCVRACVCACVNAACVRACVRGCARMRARMLRGWMRGQGRDAELWDLAERFTPHVHGFHHPIGTRTAP